MTGTSGAIIISCLLTVFTLSCESAYQQLNTIDDLKNIDFGESVPKHTLLLLHWFANTVDINNNVVRLTFDPNTEFGSNPYSNSEGILPQGSQSYSVGNLKRLTTNHLPEYVREPLFMQYEGNKDRIIFSVQEQNTGTIDRIYITQRYNDSSSGYDQLHTYQISTNLLQQLRLFSIEENQRSLSELRDQFESDDLDLSDLTNTWGDQAHLGLLLTIVCRDQNTVSKGIPRGLVGLQVDQGNHNFQSAPLKQKDLIELKVVTGKRGKAEIIWRNVRPDLLRKSVGVVLYNKEMKKKTHKIIDNSHGCFETSVSLSDGFHVRLHEIEWGFFKDTIKEEIYRGRAFQSPDPVSITGYDVRLQLFVRYGEACARLYVKKTFTDWKSDFYYSWVGFYESAEKPTNEYDTWQWARKFEQSYNSGDENTFEYCSSMTIAAGVQARFIIRDYIKKAVSPTWL